MIWGKVLLALVAVPFFYLVYYRYFAFRPEYLKHLEAFFAGVACAFALILFSPIIAAAVPVAHPAATGFLKAAVPEKVGACIIIILLHRYYPNFSVMESILSAAMFGLGFSAVENVFYSLNYGFSVIVLRLLFSVPMHLTSCGILGYYLGMRRMSETGTFKTAFLLKGLFLSVLLHGIFDSVLFQGGYASYAAPVILIGLVIILEVLMAKAQVLPPLGIINALKLRFEDYLLIDRQPRYERWILKSMGTRSAEPVHFFLWRPGFIRFSMVVAFISIAMFGLAYRAEIMQSLGLHLRSVDQIILLGNYPISVSLIIILVGAINPSFFKTSEIRIPIISDVVIVDDNQFEETLVTYDITSVNCFLRTAEPFGLGAEKKIQFEFSSYSSRLMKGVVVWENHANPHHPVGSIVSIKDSPAGFSWKFMLRYYLFRIRKGIIFNLRLPGFEATRKFFMRPISVMEEDKIFSSGTIIFEENEVGRRFYLLKKGRISFYKTKDNGERILMDTIEDEQIFGEMAVLGNVTRATTAVCETDCVVAVADYQNLTALIRNNTDFALSLVETLAHRVQTSEKILIANIHKLETQIKERERLHHITLMLAMSSLGGSLDDDDMQAVNLEKVSAILGNIDDSSIADLVDIFMYKTGGPGSRQKLAKKINDLYERITAEEKK